MTKIYRYCSCFGIGLMIIIGGIGISQSNAQEAVTFGPKETRIDGSIPYSIIGKYKARFSSFKGRIVLDDHLRRIQSVYLGN